MVSPLLFPVTIKDKTIRILDETALPLKEMYIEAVTLDEALDALSSMKTRALGQVLLFFYSCVLFAQDYTIDGLVSAFAERRPTFDFSTLGSIVKDARGAGNTVKDAVDTFIRKFDSARKRRASRLARQLPRDARLLTICNVNGELIYLYKEARALQKKVIFYVSETRPYLQGARLSFWELKKNNIPCVLVCDNAAARLLAEKKVNCVVSGADRSSTRGGIINKTGTYALARLAAHFKVPFYALTQYPRDIDIQTIPLEERPAREVFMFLKRKYSGIQAVYPSFDVVPARYITEAVGLFEKNP